MGGDGQEEVIFHGTKNNSCLNYFVGLPSLLNKVDLVKKVQQSAQRIIDIQDMVVLFSSFPIFLMEYLLSQAKSNMGYVLKLIEHYQCALCLHNEWRNSEVACLVSHQEFCYRCQGEAALERWAPLL